MDYEIKEHHSPEDLVEDRPEIERPEDEPPHLAAVAFAVVVGFGLVVYGLVYAVTWWTS